MVELTCCPGYLTMELSGTALRHHWPFIHGASAQMNVRRHASTSTRKAAAPAQRRSEAPYEGYQSWILMRRAELMVLWPKRRCEMRCRTPPPDGNDTPPFLLALYVRTDEIPEPPEVVRSRQYYCRDERGPLRVGTGHPRVAGRTTYLPSETSPGMRNRCSNQPRGYSGPDVAQQANSARPIWQSRYIELR